MLHYPTIESDRLISRHIQETDDVLWIPFCQDKACMHFLLFAHAPSPEVAARQWIDRQLQRYRDNLYGMQMLFDKASGKPIGQCGLLVQEIGGKREIEIGYHLLPDSWGKGYASEAAQAFKKLGFELGHFSIISIIDQQNHASKKVALKNNMSYDYTCVWREITVDVFRVHQ